MSTERVRYDMRGAAEARISGHPETVMAGLAALEPCFEITAKEPVAIGDCWIFTIQYERRPDLPSFVARDIGA